jgi:hypothetical protein
MIPLCDHLHVQIYTSQIIMNRVRYRGFRLTQLCFNCCSLFYSNSLLHVSVIPSSSWAKNTSQSIMTGMKVLSFRLKKLCCNSCSLFHSNNPLHVLVKRPSSWAKMCITKYNDWHKVQEFPSNAILLQ